MAGVAASLARSFPLTIWGTRLSFDDTAGEVCHTGFATSPANVIAEPAAGGALLLRHVDGASTGALAVVGERIVRAPPGADATLFDSVMQGGRQVALRVDGNHLCCERDGHVRVNRPVMGDWETLALLSEADHTLLQTLAATSWYSASNRAVVRAGGIVPSSRFLLPIGGIAPTLDDVLAAERAGHGPDGIEASRLGIVYDTWRVETLRAFRPLVLFSAFGPPATRDALAESLRALVERGAYRGPVAVLTDASASAIEAHAPPELGPLTIRSLTLESPSLAEIGWSALAAMPEFADRQPILCLGAHVSCAGPIASVLQATLLSDRVLLAGAEPARLSVIAIPSFAAVQTGLSLIRHEGAAAASARAGEALAVSVLEALGAARLDAVTGEGVASAGLCEGTHVRFVDFRSAEDGGLPAVAAMRRHRMGV